MSFDTIAASIAGTENLPILPQVVQQVLRIAENPNSSARDLEKVIQQDPVIAGKILSVANSAYYGLGGKVPSVVHAISVLGINAIRSLAIGVAFEQVVMQKSGAPTFSRVEFWRHSLAVGICAKVLGRQKMAARAEELFTAGLMHDVGHLALDRFAAEPFEQALQAAKEHNLPLIQAEREIVGCDHAQAGELVAKKWNLADDLTRAIRHHHSPRAEEDGFLFTSIIYVADTLAHQAGLGLVQTEVEYSISPKIEEALALDPDQIVMIRQVMLDELSRVQEAFKI